MNYWQIACGAWGRDYADDCIRLGMAFVGGDENVKSIQHLRAGDTVLLKRGMDLVAVGKVRERDGRATGMDDKHWLRDFDGWDLRGYAYVTWHPLEQQKPVPGLTRSTIQQVHKQHLHQVADDVLRTLPEAPTEEEPIPTAKVGDTEILDFLIGQGLRPNAAEDLTQALNRIRALASYYTMQRWDDVPEHETRTFLIVPLLIALGWPEQHMRIELPVPGGRIDVACFAHPYRQGKGNAPEDCVMILESKSLKWGLRYTREQATYYAKHYPKCRVVVVSNGYCYRVYTRDESGDFSQEATAYMNLLAPQNRYPLDPDKIGGCLETLGHLMPSLTLG